MLRDFELEEHELALLRQVCHVADLCTVLQGRVDADGPLVTTRLGEERPHPALVELRQQRILFARLVVALRVPLGDQTAGDGPVVWSRPQRRRPQRRPLRGVYGLRRDDVRGAS